MEISLDINVGGAAEEPTTIPVGFIEGVDLFFGVGMYFPFPLSTAGTSDTCDGCEAGVDSTTGFVGS